MRKLHLIMCAVALASSFQPVYSVRAAEEAGAGRAHQNYQSYCAKCHGDQGKGDGPGAAMLKPKPRDYTDCKVMQNKKDDELIKVITEGGESIGMSGDMQPWGGTLSDEEIREVVKFVRGFCKQP